MKRIIGKAIDAARAREARRKARELTSAKRCASTQAAAPASSPTARRRIPRRWRAVPGRGRVRRRHRQDRPRIAESGILPLKGKILNVEKARYEQMLGHEEIRAMITAIGTGIGKDDFRRQQTALSQIILMT